ncbi:MAG: hypothetical protein EA398_09485 [Deltaproteobacteria bacterium]|nr:MAG: hypothetical protein EA398_09485 [Deltaproteobacteria bacterium]
MKSSTFARCATCVTLVAALGMVPAVAEASGFATARFGGERGNPVEFNPTALYYNPAGIAFSQGFNAMLDIAWVYRTASYERPHYAVGGQRISDPDDNAAAIAANAGEGTVSNFLYAPMAGLTYSLEESAGIPLALGLAFYVPFGGSTIWDQVEGSEMFPGAEDGPNRWFAIEGSIRTLAFTLGAAYRIEPLRLGIGVGANLYLSDVDTLRARTGEATDRLLDEGRRPGQYALLEGRALAQASSTDFGLGVGLLWEAVEDTFWVGASWQSRPGFNGRMVYDGELTQILGTETEYRVDDIQMTSQLPDIFRLGLRYRPSSQWEVRTFMDFSRWSAFDQQCIVATNNVQGDIYDFCRTRVDGSFDNDAANNLVITNIPRRWNDAVGIRAGASFWPGGHEDGNLELLFGAGYDGNAVPDNTLEPALMDMTKFSLSLGSRIALGDNVGFMLTASNIFYQQRDTRAEAFRQPWQSGTRQPNSAGIYNQNVFIVGTNFDFAF